MKHKWLPYGLAIRNKLQLCLQVLKVNLYGTRLDTGVKIVEIVRSENGGFLFEMNSTRVMLPARVVNQSKWWTPFFFVNLHIL